MYDKFSPCERLWRWTNKRFPYAFQSMWSPRLLGTPVCVKQVSLAASKACSSKLPERSEITNDIATLGYVCPLSLHGSLLLNRMEKSALWGAPCRFWGWHCRWNFCSSPECDLEPFTEPPPTSALLSLKWAEKVLSIFLCHHKNYMS